MGGGRGNLNGGWQRDARAGLRKVYRARAEDEPECRDDLKEDKCLDRHTAHAAKFVVPRDAGDNASKDQRRNDHADEAEKDFSQEMRLGREGWRTRSDIRTEMRSDATHFHISAELQAYENGTCVATRQWAETIARDLM